MILLLSVMIGAMVGWTISEFIPSKELGIASHIMIGIIGALIGGYFFKIVSTSLIYGIITAIITATSLVFVGRIARIDTP